MSTFYRSATFPRAWVFLTIFLGAVSAYSRTVTWDAVPFPTDSNWGGPTGQPASISSNEVVLDGQPARSEETFSGPFVFSCDVSLDARNASDGAFWLFFIPPETPLDHGLTNSVFFQLGYDGNSGIDTTGLFRRSGTGPDTALWTITNPLSAGTTNHISLGVAADGTLSLSLNGQPYSLPDTALLPFSQFQMQIQGWQPDNFWHVTNFTAVPEPSTVGLVGLGLAGLLVGSRRRKSGGGTGSVGW